MEKILNGKEVRRRETVGFCSSGEDLGMEKILNGNKTLKGKDSKPKGQMAIIAAIIIVIGIIMLEEMLGIYSTIEEKRSQESIIIDKMLLNIKDEYKNIAGASSLHSNSSGIQYLYNFSALLWNDLQASVLYVYVFSNASSQNYSVTIGNFLGSRINATINATNSTQPVRVYDFINDKTNSTKQFDFSTNGTINMTLQYNINGANVTETFRVPVSTSRNSVFGFFDIELESGRITVRSKEIFNRTAA